MGVVKGAKGVGGTQRDGGGEQRDSGGGTEAFGGDKGGGKKAMGMEWGEQKGRGDREIRGWTKGGGAKE